MKKISRKKKVIIGAAIFFLVLVSVGVIGVNYAFNKIMDSAIDIAPDGYDQANNAAVSSPMPMPSGTKSSNEQTRELQTYDKELTKKQILELNKKGIAYDEKYGEVKIEGKAAEGTVKYNDPKNKNWNVTSAQLGASVNKKDIEKFKENASLATKAQVVKYVMGRFSGGEIDEMSQIAQGGITLPEKKRLHDIVYAKFSKSELQDLMKKYNTYK